MAKLNLIKPAPDSYTRTYSLARQTTGTWLYLWSGAPDDTPEWAKKWYVLKSDFPTCPGKKMLVTVDFE